MKIAFDYQIFYLQKFGGISKYYYNLALNLIENNPETKIFAPIFKNFYGKDLAKKNILKGKYISDYPRFTSKLINKLNFHLSDFYLKKFNPDIFHITYFNQAYRNKLNTKNILTVYDLIHEKYSHYYDYSYPKKKALEYADHIICISENTKSDLLKYYNVDEKKISTIYLGVDNNHFGINKIKRNKKYILYVGERSKYKNFKNFIVSFSKSKMLLENFDIICFGGGQFNSNEIKYFKDLKIPENSIFYFSGDDQYLKSFYLGAEFLIIPSFYEGFGLPLIEAMSFNCPVLCSKTSSLEEISGDAAIFFDPNKYEDMKVTMENFIIKTDKEDIIKKGRINSLKYTWKKCTNETLKIYKNIANI